MKTKITISIILGITALAFVFNGTTGTRNSEQVIPNVPVEKTMVSPPVGGGTGNDFLVGCLMDGDGYTFNYCHDSLGFNLWHSYCSGSYQGPNGWYYPMGWAGCPNDSLFSDNSQYPGQVQGKLSLINSHNMKALMQRPKIDYLCYGKRSDYMCVDKTLIDDADYWFYTFQSPNHVGQDVIDNGASPGHNHYVRYCRAANSTNGGNWVDDSGCVVSRLRTNSEQSCRDNSTVGWHADTQHDWYIKPRIKADSSYIANHSNDSICRIDVYNSSGSLFKQVMIRARNFQDQNFQYDGNYLDTFNFTGNDSTLTYRGDWVGTDTTDLLWVYASRGNNTDSTQYLNHADIQIYWYGNCDAWFDYVRVDNDIANDLFKGVYDNPIYGSPWLQWEAQEIACSPYNQYEFYIELFAFSNIPCIAYVNHKIDSLCGKHIDMVADEQNNYSIHVNWNDRSRVENAGHIKRNFIDMVGATHFIMESYPFTSAYVDPPNPDPNITYSRIPISHVKR